ncbi:MAG: TRAP transporter large permease subunit [Planctomycetaceae bacterium]|nr:TRAP transporter large permease subunit [Planctomycetaceae bacterium]
MFVLLFGLFVCGVPISFALASVAACFAYLLWGTNGMMSLIQSTWGTMNNFTLMAVPLFVFMAMMLEKSTLVEDLYNAFYKWSGPVRGGLAMASIIVGAIIGAVSGVVAAGIIGMGLIALPQMDRYKYDRSISLGSVLAGGTLGQLIPPSLNMIIYGAVCSVSVGGLFASGISAGLLLVFLYCVYIFVRCLLNKNLCPSLPPSERATIREKFQSLKALILPTALIVTCLGAILTGVTTPTEGAAVGALGAVIFNMVCKRFSWAIFKDSAIATIKLSAMVAWMVACANSFGSIFAGIGGNRMIMELALQMPGGKWGALFASMMFIFFLGMFLETAGLIMLAAPIVTPIIVKLGFEPLWWGIIFMTLLQCAYISPPFGLSLFYLKGITPEDVSLMRIYKAGLPFLALQVIGIVLMVLFPMLGVWAAKML